MLQIPIPATLEPLRSAAQSEFPDRAGQAGIPDANQENYFDAIFAIAAWIYRKSETAEQFSLGVSGAQGSGKSTFATLLAQLLDSTFQLSTCVLSLDDFYLTRATRLHLASEIHPLLEVRGVPGTHDMSLMNEAVSNLKSGVETRVPRFDKAMDDRDGYRVLTGRPRVLILEGWCWGALPVPEQTLQVPVNELEAKRDPDAVWRRYVNKCLSSAEYQGAFSSVDALCYLAVPDLEAVYRWRLQQERALGQRGNRVMDEAQVREFIMYYERITRQMLTDLPERADITLYLDDAHAVDSLTLRRTGHR